MASAKKCDICGKLYEIPRSLCDVVKVDIDIYPATHNFIDLCDDCYKKLCDFAKPAIPEGILVERKRS